MNEPELDLDVLARRLWQVTGQDPQAGPLVIEPWLLASWKDGKSITALLTKAHEQAQPPTKSVLKHGVDFYYDAVARHAAASRDRPALRYFDPSRGWQSLSYGELHSQSNRLVARWLTRGVAPSCKLVLLGEIGPQWLLSLFSALRLGATVCLLPSIGIDFALHRLPALSPDHIVCEPLMLALLRSRLDKALAAKLLCEEPLPGTHHSGSHTYPPDSPALLLYTPVRDPLDKPTPVPARLALVGALRDGLLLSLRPGDHIAYPLADFLQHQPMLILTTLLAGATWVHIPQEELLRNPRLLGNVPLRVLGVIDAVRDLLLKTPSGLLSELKLWFRNPEEPQQVAAWDRFLKLTPFPATPHLNLVFDGAAGGAVLFSERTLRRIHGHVLPVPGVPFELKMTAPAGPKSVSDHGLFTAQTQKPGYMILARTPDSYLYGGTLTPRRSGRLFATQDVVAVARTLPAVQDAAVVAVPATEQPGKWLFVLLLFCGGTAALQERTNLAAQLREELEKKLRAQLGPAHLPDVIEVYPISARRQETATGPLDEAWVQSLFASGLLQRKAELAPFRSLSALRTAALRTPLGRLVAAADPGPPTFHDDKDDTDA
ncbi:MAG: AMP-binding protein [Myxococcales bacterium]|nr:AMP-binding protein [Myxococcales bacterium]